jgi:hypothetical protein
MVWPANTIPEELFTAIAQFLSREDICNLRLTNREFSVKLQDTMFRSVVVPLTTSVYSTSENGCSEASSRSIDIFEKLGDHIYKFGMSFELDEGIIHALILLSFRSVCSCTIFPLYPTY